MTRKNSNGETKIRIETTEPWRSNPPLRVVLIANGEKEEFAYIFEVEGFDLLDR